MYESPTRNLACSRLKGADGVNVRIDKNTKLQPWNANSIFGDYPVHIRSGNLTITLLFEDTASIGRFRDLLEATLVEIGFTGTASTRDGLGLLYKNRL